MKAFLSEIPLFSGLNEADLNQLIELADELEYGAGDVIFTEGESSDRTYIIYEGQVEILKSHEGREVLLAVRSMGEMVGETAMFEEKEHDATAIARTDVKAISISKEEMDILLDMSPHASRALFQTVLARLRSRQTLLRQSEKMAQLGTLSAGLAHELNNPSSAVSRGVNQMSAAMDKLLDSLRAIRDHSYSEEQRTYFDELTRMVKNAALNPPDIDSVTRSDLEETIEEYLDNHDVEDAWVHAPLLVNLQPTAKQFEKLESLFDKSEINLIIGYLGNLYGAYSLFDEVYHGAERISSIVIALKEYSHLDQAPVGEIDLHQGINNTLVILRNKLKKGITVVKDYDREMPKVEAYGSELNQVWTNLLDNAAYALNGNGKIRIKTRRRGDWIIVDIIDNGPGIPKDVKSKIFNPFFTTKPPGQGSGLGLDISYNIIANKHKGDIKVFSQPGNTCFRVILPLNFATLKSGSSPSDFLLRPSDDKLLQILTNTKTIAVVGISQDENQPSNSISQYLQEQGYLIIPVNPKYEVVLAEKAYSDLESVPTQIDVILVFRPSEAVFDIVQDAISLKSKPKIIWTQEGIINEEAAELALSVGIDIVMDQCMRVNHKRLKLQISE